MSQRELLYIFMPHSPQIFTTFVFWLASKCLQVLFHVSVFFKCFFAGGRKQRAKYMQLSRQCLGLAACGCAKVDRTHGAGSRLPRPPDSTRGSTCRLCANPPCTPACTPCSTSSCRGGSRRGESVAAVLTWYTFPNQMTWVIDD